MSRVHAAMTRESPVFAARRGRAAALCTTCRIFIFYAMIHRSSRQAARYLIPRRSMDDMRFPFRISTRSGRIGQRQDICEPVVIYLTDEGYLRNPQAAAERGDFSV
jgi:hypothetical protein